MSKQSSCLFLFCLVRYSSTFSVLHQNYNKIAIAFEFICLSSIIHVFFVPLLAKFYLLILIGHSYFRWPVLHLGAEQLRPAGPGERMPLTSHATACQISWWDSLGTGCCWWGSQLCPVSLRSCVWLGKEQLRAAGLKWWTRYEKVYRLFFAKHGFYFCSNHIPCGIWFLSWCTPFVRE